MSLQALKALKAKRAAIKAHCTRTRIAIDATNPQAIDAACLKQRKEKFVEQWDRFHEIQSQIIEVLTSATDIEDIEQLMIEQETECINFEDNYFSIAGKLEQLASTQQTITNNMQSPSAAQVSTEGYVRDITQIHLPKIAIPKFGGNYEDWYPFYNTFESMIHSNPKLTDIQRFHYLISSLEGDAAHVIKSLEITADNYSEALSLLTQRYDDKRVIAQQHIKALFDLPTITKGNYVALRKLVDDVLRHTRSLKGLGRPTDQWDDLVIHLIITKLDSSMVSEWEDQVPAGIMPTLKQLTEFLVQKCKTMSVVSKKAVNDSLNSRKVNKISNTHIATANIFCVHCKGKHHIFQCSDFLKLSSADRYKEVKAKQLCINCLRSTTHQAKDCKSSTCQTCHKKHNTLLHISDKAQKDNETVNSVNQTSNSNTITLNHHVIQDEYQVILSTAVVNALDQNGNSHACRILLDSGSQSNFITMKFADKLKLTRRPANMSVTGINHSQTHSCHTVKVRIQSIHTSFSQEIECYTLDTITENLPRVNIRVNNFNIPGNIRLADPHFHVPGEIDMLVGAELFWQLICINQILAKFWDLEHIPNESPFSPEERACMEHFVNTTTRNKEGRLVVQMPIRETKLQELSESRTVALSRFLSMERKLKGQPSLRKQYARFMEEYLELGHMKRINEQTLSHSPRYYIPHHAVLKSNSLTTKVRVVFDASCKTSTGVSLNDCLLVGPTLQQDLFSILLRFRTFRYVITADITQMYRQVRIDETQTSLQTIFWRSDPSEEIAAFELQTVTYGTACTSFLAIRCMQELASINAPENPIGAATIINDFYVDDLLSGADTESEVKRLRDETIKVLKQGGFQLRKWASNSPKILEDLNHTDVNTPVHFINKDEEVCTLGMHWNTIHDDFQYNINVTNIRKVTKRSMLSALSKIFDPLGLVGPVTLTAKVLIQRVWQLNLAWDETVPMDIHTTWVQYESQLNMISNFKIPRYVACKDALSTQLHGFLDASEKAYGACIYVRVINTQGQGQTRLLCSRSRVAPLKTISLPRLELCGALLLAQLIDKVLKPLRFVPESTFYWTDSTIVLQWIKVTDRKWNTFVANRIGEIHKLSSSGNWHHVTTECNPADFISRGSLLSALINSELWWSGPIWLRKESQSWNTDPLVTPPEDLPEQKRTVKVMISTEDPYSQDLFTKFSSLTKLIRISALCLRFARNVRNKPIDRTTGRITTQELKDANSRLVKNIQEAAFKDDLRVLKSKGRVSQKSNLLSLSPFIDEQNILRVGGRLRNAIVTPDVKHPMLLPADHAFTCLVIAHEHHRHLHAGAQATLAAVRTKYWPLSARNSVKKYIRSCIICFKAAPRVSDAVMSHLPTYRVTLAKPFASSGVDYAGPFNIKSGQLRNAKIVKAYIAMFVCLATKAVHIELVSSLSTEAFLNALKRFIARRGKVSHIYSDNGTNFQGACNKLKEFYQMLRNEHHKERVDHALKEDFLEWHFIPPHAPHFGGIWEAAVKSAKNHLKRVIADIALTFEEMYTVLTQIEAIMNSRPLTPLSNDPNDLSYLTPGHFLVGDALTSVP